MPAGTGAGRGVLVQRYQTLLFGCISPFLRPGNRDDYQLAETIRSWIAQLAERRIILDWRTDAVVIAPLPEEQGAVADVLGIVIACSHPDARHYPRPVALLFDPLPEDTGAQSLAELCLPLSEDIERARLRWEIARFAARGIGLDLPSGRLFLIEGWCQLPSTKAPGLVPG
jgi:hypothetical protein